MKKERNHSDIFIKAIALNKLTYHDIVYICDRTESTVFKWLNGSLVPDGLAIVQLLFALRSARMKIPRELNRCYSALIQRSHKWGDKNKTSNKHPKMVGEKLVEMKGAAFFIYKNELLSRKEISDKARMKYATVYSRTKNNEYNTDVTEIIDKNITKGRKRLAK